MTNITKHISSAKPAAICEKTEEKTGHGDKQSPRCNFPAGMLFNVAQRLEAPVCF